VRCFGFGWDLVSAVAAGFVGSRKFGKGLYNAFNGWMLRFEGRGSRFHARRNREESGNNGSCGNYLKS
jgi:hypothetical protein